MEPKKLLLHMSRRLYEDIRFVAEQNPAQPVDDDGTRSYNSLLARVRMHFSYCDFINDFGDWSARNIKYKDALIVAGQLHAMIEALMPRELVTRAASQWPASEAAEEVAAEAAPNLSDEELYGNAAIRRNEDGTIPFTLD